MKNLKIYKSKVLILLVVFSFPLIFAACDTDDCFSNDSYKSLKTEKAAPGSQPIADTDC